MYVLTCFKMDALSHANCLQPSTHSQPKMRQRSTLCVVCCQMAQRIRTTERVSVRCKSKHVLKFLRNICRATDCLRFVGVHKAQASSVFNVSYHIPKYKEKKPNKWIHSCRDALFFSASCPGQVTPAKVTRPDKIVTRLDLELHFSRY